MKTIPIVSLYELGILQNVIADRIFTSGPTEVEHRTLDEMWTALEHMRREWV